MQNFKTVSNFNVVGNVIPQWVGHLCPLHQDCPDLLVWMLLDMCWMLYHGAVLLETPTATMSILFMQRTQGKVGTPGGIARDSPVVSQAASSHKVHDETSKQM